MKASPVLFLAAGLWAGALAAPAEDPALPRKFTWVDASDPAVAEIVHLGETTIQKVGSNLVVEVNRVVAAKGPEAGIDDLHLQQLRLPAAPPGRWQITAVKRTSLKVRNQVNLPDNADLAALMSIQSALADGDRPPKVLVQRLAADGSVPAEWRVYRLIVTTSACLACHGPVASLKPEVKAKLDYLYPWDKAVDYDNNEWRGVIRVSIQAPAGPTPAPKK